MLCGGRAFWYLCPEGRVSARMMGQASSAVLAYSFSIESEFMAEGLWLCGTGSTGSACCWCCIWPALRIAGMSSLSSLWSFVFVWPFHAGM